MVVKSTFAGDAARVARAHALLLLMIPVQAAGRGPDAATAAMTGNVANGLLWLITHHVGIRTPCRPACRPMVPRRRFFPVDSGLLRLRLLLQLIAQPAAGRARQRQ